MGLKETETRRSGDVRSGNWSVGSVTGVGSLNIHPVKRKVVSSKGRDRNPF